jgi:sulfur carrier protein ThiS adenylyltransferase
MNLFKIRSYLSKFTVGIAGAGGLGSNCAVALARSGIGKLVICDYDIIEAGNLNRQYYFANQIGKFKSEALKENILKIDASIDVVTYKEEINRNNVVKLFSKCDIIVEALDKAEKKEMFIESVQILLKGIPLVAGSGMAGWGNFHKMKTRKIDDTLYVCGDETSEDSEETPMLAPRVAIAANMQADIVIDLLLKKAHRENYFE